MILLISGLILFLGVHSISILAPTWRDNMVGRLGLMAWQGIYSILAIAGLYLVIKGYSTAQQLPTLLYSPPEWLRYVSLILMLLVFPLLLATYLPGRIQATTKHPMLAGTKTWALAHLLANGSLADVVLFGSFLLWAVIDRISLKQRKTIAVPGLPSSPINDVIAIVAGLAVYGIFIFGLHEGLFGVQPY